MNKMVQKVFILMVLINSQIGASELAQRASAAAQEAATDIKSAALKTQEEAARLAKITGEKVGRVATRIGKAFSFKDSAPTMIKRAKDMSDEMWLKVKDGMGKVITKFDIQGNTEWRTTEKKLGQQEKREKAKVNSTLEGQEFITAITNRYAQKRLLSELQIEREKLQRLENAANKFPLLKSILNLDGIKEQKEKLNTTIEAVTKENSKAEEAYEKAKSNYNASRPRI